MIRKTISKIEMMMTHTTRMESTTTENYGDTRIVIKPIATVTMTMMIIHNVFIVRNVNTISMIMTVIASVSVHMKMK